MKSLPPAPMHCPHCGAKYNVVRVEAAPGLKDREVICLSCGGPLAAREGAFVIKHFLAETQSKRQRRVQYVP
jgi:predicted Zn finger-like uncharacterized protein